MTMLNKLTLPARKAPTVDTPPAVKAADAEKTFLQSFLNDGPRLRTYVYRAAEDEKLSWEKVKAVFADLHGQEYVQKGDWFWRLPQT